MKGLPIEDASGNFIGRAEFKDEVNDVLRREFMLFTTVVRNTDGKIVGYALLPIPMENQRS